MDSEALIYVVVIHMPGPVGKRYSNVCSNALGKAENYSDRHISHVVTKAKAISDRSGLFRLIEFANVSAGDGIDKKETVFQDTSTHRSVLDTRRPVGGFMLCSLQRCGYYGGDIVWICGCRIRRNIVAWG